MTANTATGNKMFDNAYTYDRIGNILSLTNDAVATGPNPIGGKFGHGYTYDLFNRLTTANSYWEYEEGNQDLYTNELTLGYGDMHRISYKNQEQLRDGNIVPEHSYFKDYAYTTGRNHIQQITNNGVSSGNYKYDLNGNMRNITEPGLPVSTRYFAWDEANRLKAVRKADALVQHHLYDANGERSHKGISNLFYMGINGGPQGYDHYIGNYQLYPSGYLTVGEYDLVTKHYYTGTQRIASRLAGDVTDFHAANEVGEYGVQTKLLDGRQKNDIKAAFDQLKLSYPAIWNVPGMVPPCNQGEEGDELCDCVFQHQCGTGPIYFFHSDHLGSSTFLTDGSGQPYQFFLNLPFGETMEEQFALSPNVWWKTPYLFNGKELDSKTSLYYYGARYYDPGLSVWLSVDPRAEKYPEWSPYNYVLGNPIRNIDPHGDTVRVAVGNEFINYTPGMEYTGDNKFAQGVINSLNTMNSSEAGSEVLGSLVASENNYSFVNVVSTDKNGNPVEGVRFRKGENGGGTIEAGASNDVGTIAHELFHGYQIESGLNPATTAGEVGAYLFQDVVTLQAGVPFGSSASTNEYGMKYDAAHSNLLFNGFNDSDYISANIFFKFSSKNATGLYNRTKRTINTFPKPPIAKFLPAFK